MNRSLWLLAIGLSVLVSMAADGATPRAERLGEVEVFSEGYPRAFQFWTTTRRMIMEGEVDTARAAPWTGYPVEVARRMTVSVSTEAKPRECATFVNTRPFSPRLYFRNVKGPKVGLRFEVEGVEPIWLSSITSHAHADATYRLFENGLVLANPSDSSYEFDLSTISPGIRYRRLRGSLQQDPTTNNGKPVGDTVTLAARDGLFLVRVESGE